jgi:hypothetical protein
MRNPANNPPSRRMRSHKDISKSLPVEISICSDLKIRSIDEQIRLIDRRYETIYTQKNLSGTLPEHQQKIKILQGWKEQGYHYCDPKYFDKNPSQPFKDSDLALIQHKLNEQQYCSFDKIQSTKQAIRNRISEVNKSKTKKVTIVNVNIVQSSDQPKESISPINLTPQNKAPEPNPEANPLLSTIFGLWQKITNSETPHPIKSPSNLLTANPSLPRAKSYPEITQTKNDSDPNIFDSLLKIFTDKNSDELSTQIFSDSPPKTSHSAHTLQPPNPYKPHQTLQTSKSLPPKTPPYAMSDQKDVARFQTPKFPPEKNKKPQRFYKNEAAKIILDNELFDCFNDKLKPYNNSHNPNRQKERREHFEKMSQTIETFCEQNLEIKNEKIYDFINKFRSADNNEDSIGSDYDEESKIKVLKQMRRYVKKLDNLDKDKKEGLLVLLDHLRYNLILRVIWKTPVKDSMPLLDNYLTKSESFSEYRAKNTYEVFSYRGLDGKESQHTENNYLFDLGYKYNHFKQINEGRALGRTDVIGQGRVPSYHSRKPKNSILDETSRKAQSAVQRFSENVDQITSLVRI